MKTTRGQTPSAGTKGGAVARMRGLAATKPVTVHGQLRPSVGLWPAACGAAWASWLLIGCGHPKVPAPDVAIDRYVSAVQSGDAETVWSMMNSSARQNISRPELARLLAENHKELIKRASGFQSAERRIEQRAVMFLDRGSQIELVLEGGQFHVKYQELLVAAAASPHAALENLRSAVKRRDYQRVLGLLGPDLKVEVEASGERLLQTLSELDGAVLDVQGDTATYTFPGGGVVQLKKVGATWLITELP